ncbi:hypothetical protein SB48_HM08orf02158 [Heyndrickxia coagulans]|uniref:Uncharacterized protein n=1 Tax=Heyndrickxia coagulans TaxID=1398 RepID=A0AAN0T5R1_HEYCO|nr:hypothetical protein SB48_HM08orf02158 [Heyndrickxia coagulans]
MPARVLSFIPLLKDNMLFPVLSFIPRPAKNINSFYNQWKKK